MFNQGNYKWKFEETKDRAKIIFELQVPKFLDTSLLIVDVEPTYVRVDVKGKITQLHWPDEVLVD